jgi:COMPASS component SWD2
VHYVIDSYVQHIQIVRRLVGHRGLERDRNGNKAIDPRRGASGEELCWTADSRWVISGSADGKVVAWDLTLPPGQTQLPLLPPGDETIHPSTVLREGGGANGPTRAVKANPRFGMMAVGGDDLVRVTELTANRELTRFL